ncbi:MAG: N-acetyltransferase family protein [Lachnospiraceae bacterium]|nr:GNAT family N-acetyltransferase [Dorea sp.]
MAKEKDAGLVMSFIRQLSVYEEMEDSVQATEELLRENLFRKKGAEVLFAVVDKKEVGMALYTAGFAGYLGKQNLFLDTLYVAEEYRREGVGQAIFKKLAEIAKERGYGRIEWICLKENQPGMNFYQKQRANMLDSCVTFRMEEDVMHGLSE